MAPRLTLDLGELNGEVVPVGSNNAVRLLLQKHAAQTYPEAYPQHFSLCTRLWRAARGIVARLSILFPKRIHPRP